MDAGEYRAFKTQQDRESAGRAAGAAQSPLQSSGGGGWTGAPAGQPTERPGLAGKGFSPAELRQLHEAAGTPATTRRSFGVSEGDQ